MRGGLALLTLDATQKSRAISFGDTRRFPRYGPYEQAVDQEIEEHRTLRCCRASPARDSRDSFRTRSGESRPCASSSGLTYVSLPSKMRPRTTADIEQFTSAISAVRLLLPEYLWFGRQQIRAMRQPSIRATPSL